MDILLIASLGAIFLCLVLLLRNISVFNYRSMLLDKVSAKSLAEIDAQEFKNWEARYSEYSQVSYDEMVLKFWKPLRSFYSTDFLEDIGVKK